MKQYDGDAIFSKETERIQSGRQPDWLNLIFFPLMRSRNSVRERVAKVIRLCSQTRLKRSHYEAIISAVLVLADKFLSQKDYENIWEDISMLNVIKFAEKKGMDEGIGKGIKMIVMMQLLHRFHDLSEDYKKRIEQLSEQKLEQIAKDIFTIENVEDLEKYLQ